MLNHLEAKKLFSRYKIELEGVECASIEDAAGLISSNSPCFLKLVSSNEEATHKTEFGYVQKVTNTAELGSAWKEMSATAASHGHGDVRFILQEGKTGHEVMIGAKRDPIFGFQVIFTPEGGKYAEILARVAPPSVRVGRIQTTDALEMIMEHPLSSKIVGARGEKPCDIKSLAGLLVSISKLMYENPDVQAIDLNPVFVRPDGISLVDARVETTASAPAEQSFYTNRDMTVFKHPKSAFVVLASAKPKSVGMLLLENVLASVGNDVKVMLPSGKGIEDLAKLGVEVVGTVPEGCELLIYAGMPTAAPEIVAKFREKGGKGAVIISSDFAETGNFELEKSLQEAAGEMPYIGPNGLGVYSSNLNTYFIPEDRLTYPSVGGGVAFFSQSGGLCLESFCDYLQIHGVPVNEIFSMGNGSGISFTELVNSAGWNPSVKTIVVHLEGGLKEGEGPHFIDALRRTSQIKPVIVLPAGLSEKGRKSAASHTGRMTGGADALIAALKQGGAIVADTEEQLRLAIWMLHVMPRATEKTVVFTSGGGKGVFATDAAERVALSLRDRLPKEFSERVSSAMPAFADSTQNPFDFTGSVTLDAMISVLKHSKMLESPGILHLFYQVPGATLMFKDGKSVRIDVLDAVDLIAKTIKDNDLPFILNICAQSQIARNAEAIAERQGIVVTRTATADLLLSAIKLVTEVWEKYPNIELRQQSKASNEAIPSMV